MRVNNLQPAELAAWLSDPARSKPLLLDVREPWEFQTCRIPDSMLVPMRELPARLGEIDPAAAVVVICHHGARSLRVRCSSSGRDTPACTTSPAA
jgi:rhodanese-related sulfurtransferase